MTIGSENKDPVWSAYWDDNKLPSSGFDIQLFKLSKARRIVENFVHILTGKSIPVKFMESTPGQQQVGGATDGDVVYISSNITESDNWDSNVGLSLHEGAHVLLTDFSQLKLIKNRSTDLYKLGQRNSLSREFVYDLIFTMVNYVEDRYIDNYVFSSSPGYRPYYVSMYDTYFNDPRISSALKSSEFRTLDVKSYKFRILNLTNPDSDLSALPGLLAISNRIDINNIQRLSTTKQRIQIANDVVEIILKQILEHPAEQPDGDDNQSSAGCPETDKPNVSADASSDDMEVKGSPADGKVDNESSGSSDSEDSSAEGDGDSTKETADDTSNQTSEQASDIEQLNDVVNEILDKQTAFLKNHAVNKKHTVDTSTTMMLDVVENSNTELLPVSVTGTNGKVSSVDCIVSKRLTESLLKSDVFPLARRSLFRRQAFSPTASDWSADQWFIKLGIIMGVKLGRRIQLRREVNVSKHSRKSCGKIDRRLLSDIGVGSSAIFYKTKTDKYGKLNLHISVDASGSMKVGDKWDKTMTLIVAICKAASMVNNLRVIVSFRSTISVKSTVRVSNLIPPNSMLPYVVIAYDSNVDKFSKVTSFFSKLCPGGYTPEGLTFDAIQNTLPAISANEQNHLLIISDGIPCFEHKNEKTGHHTTYDKSSGAIHTKRQYELLKRNGVKGIAYFIKTPPNAATSIKLPGTYDNSDAVSTFKLMYGADARFIEVDDVLQISNTLNALFLDSVDKND